MVEEMEEGRKRVLVEEAKSAMLDSGSSQCDERASRDCVRWIFSSKAADFADLNELLKLAPAAHS